ncbi:DNA-binding NarL/FixJ family response regulator [Kibdelosporangium banguiense]|uniref:DNA-binding NarL/FixJ family response regulator n=1 Tax=Kibdelosporangium banguiense TaxID=1365924 RepID=A0ABS4TX01_9PSEU|nr:response regulator transcription factor [Kibdelosporangium banguiense]MBP2328938.1 DNA-binding NarL/FixJ family response regulator [Kibdelosporangium banguiense]
MPVRVYVIDDHEIVRRGLLSVLEIVPGIEVVGDAPNGRVALDEFLPSPRPPADVVLMDLVMPVCDGISASRELRKRFPDLRILVLSSFGDLRYVRPALELGVSGYLLKDAPPETVVEAVRAVFDGRLYLDQRVSAALSAAEKSTPVDGLTRREREVLRLVARGLSSQDIADVLVLSERTTRTHISHLLTKFGMRSRIQLALWAHTNGFDADAPTG